MVLTETLKTRQLIQYSCMFKCGRDQYQQLYEAVCQSLNNLRSSVLNVVCQLLHVDAVLVICSVFGSQNYKQEHNILHVMETCMNCLTKLHF